MPALINPARRLTAPAGGAPGKRPFHPADSAEHPVSGTAGKRPYAPLNNPENGPGAPDSSRVLAIDSAQDPSQASGHTPSQTLADTHTPADKPLHTALHTPSPRFPEPLVHELAFDQLERLLLWCVDQRASDIVFCPNDPVWMQVDGVWHMITDSVLNDAETQMVVNETSGQSNRAGLVKTGRSIDYACALRIPGQKILRQRFRVNATSSVKGVYVVMRVLPRLLPRLEDMEGLNERFQRALFPESGLVVVSGVMGSGKSTLLAAILHEAVKSRAVGRQILTLEDPLEFDFSTIDAHDRVAPVTQSTVHVDVEDWPSGVRTLTRRKGEIVMVGECRDRETVAALLSTVEQGVTAYTTVHARDVPQTLTRMINAFPEEERSSMAAVLLANARVLVHQRLVRRDPKAVREGVPGRVALREILVLDEGHRRELLRLPLARLPEAMRALVDAEGQSLLADARAKFALGVIPEEVLSAIVREYEVERG